MGLVGSIAVSRAVVGRIQLALSLSFVTVVEFCPPFFSFDPLKISHPIQYPPITRHPIFASIAESLHYYKGRVMKGFFAAPSLPQRRLFIL
jgi:hypothetical protein